MSADGTSGVDRENALVRFYRWVFGIGYARNVGGVERTIRYAGGALSLLVGAGVLFVPVLGDALANAVVALALIVTGLYLIYEARVQYCPLNRTLERSTYPEG